MYKIHSGVIFFIVFFLLLNFIKKIGIEFV